MHALIVLCAICTLVHANRVLLDRHDIVGESAVTFHSLRRSLGALVPLVGIPATAYTAVLGFGTPQKNFSLVVCFHVVFEF